MSVLVDPALLVEISGRSPSLSFRCCRQIALGAAYSLAWLATAAAAEGATYTVDSINNHDDETVGDGACSTAANECTLRAAIQEANADGGFDTIAFDVPGPGPHSIVAAAGLPAITSSVTIDGYSEPDATANTDPVASNAVISVRLFGPGRTAEVDGITVQASDVKVSGLRVSGFSTGINVKHGASSVSIQGCAVTDSRIGIDVAGSFHLIGGSQPEHRNVITNNNSYGVRLFGRQGEIQGNLIGLDASGNLSSSNHIGIGIWGERHVIGGTTPAKRNIISANTGFGISLRFSRELVFQGNFIGTDATGRLARGNGQAGISSFGDESVRIGGQTAEEGNRIAFNRGSGVRVADVSRSGISIIHNQIYRNGRLGIDLMWVGDEDGLVTENDELDGDDGPNSLQNFPTLTAFNAVTGTVEGTLHSLRNTTFQIDLYGNPEPDPSLHGEGMAHVGRVLVLTDGDGNADFEITPTPDGFTFFSATATHFASKSTSEFSDMLGVVAGTYSVGSADDSGAGSLRDGIDSANANTDEGAFVINIEIPAGPQTTVPSAPYAQIERSVIIDGSRTAGFLANTAPLPDARNGNTPFAIQGDPSMNCLAVGPDSSGGAPVAIITDIQINGCRDGLIIQGGSVLGIGLVMDSNDIAIEVFPGSPTSSESRPGAFGAAGLPVLPPTVLIGGPSPAQRVDISASTFAGLLLASPGNQVHNSSLSGNQIGIALLGDDNLVHGSAVTGSVTHGVGLFDFGTPPTGNRISENSIADSGGLGVDLNADGVTPNDAGDADSGPNELQNFPVLTGALAVGSGEDSVLISGTLESSAGQVFEIEFFASSACNASGNGEGERFLGSASVATGDDGSATFTAELPAAAVVGDEITATAVDGNGNTSEFSACKTAVAAPPLPNIEVGPVPVDFGQVELGGLAMETVTITNGGDANLSIWSISGPQSSEFVLTSDGCGGEILAPAAWCEVDVDFMPLADELYADEIAIASDDPGEPVVQVQLVGEGSVTGACPGTDVLVLADQTITTTESFEACTQITVGPGVEISSPGTVVLRAGSTVLFVAAVTVGTGAELTVEIDRALLP